MLDVTHCLYLNNYYLLLLVANTFHTCSRQYQTWRYCGFCTNVFAVSCMILYVVLLRPKWPLWKLKRTGCVACNVLFRVTVLIAMVQR